MLLRKKKKTSDGNYPAHGWKKVWRWMKQIILFPIRHPLITLAVLLFLFLAPTFRGVKPVNVHKWYGTQIVNAYNKVLVWWGVRQPEVTPGEFKFHPEEAAPAPVTPSEFNVPELNDEEAPNILDVLRGEPEVTTESTEEEKVESSPELEKTAEDKKEEKLPAVEEPQPTEADISQPQETMPTKGEPLAVEKETPPAQSPASKLYAYPQSKKISTLQYLAQPEEISGLAKVYNCNEIEVNGVYVLLYGIYLHPYTAPGEKTTQHLKDWLDNQNVKCGIVAYTDQNVATGICYFRDTNINKDLILKGYTRNVAL